jgi:hypothetical protein
MEIVHQSSSEIRIVPFDPTYTKTWDDFVWQSNNGTLFHTRAFLAYHPPQRFHDESLLFFKAGKLLAVFPAATRPDENERVLRSHPGASFGGFVTGSHLAFHDAGRIITHFLAHCRERGYDGVDLTVPPQIYLDQPGNHLEFWLFQNGFRYRKREMTNFVPLNLPAGRVLELFSPEARRKVQRAQKLGVQVRDSDDMPAFYEILLENRKLRHNVQPVHSLEELITLRSMFPERIRLLTAHVENEMIAGIVLFVCNSRAALSFYVGHREAFQQYRSVNLLFYEVMRWCTEQGLRFFDFGTFTINMQPNQGLARFEEGLGAHAIFRDTMEIRL